MQLYAKDRQDQQEWGEMLSEAFDRYHKELNQQHDRDGLKRIFEGAAGSYFLLLPACTSCSRRTRSIPSLTQLTRA